MLICSIYLSIYGGLSGPLAMIGRKLRQVRKEATVATDSCAGVWLGRLPPVPKTPLINVMSLLFEKQKLVASQYYLFSRLHSQLCHFWTKIVLRSKLNYINL